MGTFDFRLNFNQGNIIVNKMSNQNIKLSISSSTATPKRYREKKFSIDISVFENVQNKVMFLVY